MRENHTPQILQDLINDTPSPFVPDEASALEYLYFVNRTNWNNLATLDIIDYEKLFFIEQKYKNNPTIQNLIDIIKENIAKNFEYKNKWLARIMDKNILLPLENQYIKDIDLKYLYFMGNLYAGINSIEPEQDMKRLDKKRKDLNNNDRSSQFQKI